MNEIVLKTEKLAYVYSDGTPFRRVAIDDVSIEIEKGELVGIIGHTGSGKSTLIQHFNGLLKQTEGTVYVKGKDIWANKSDIRQVRFTVGLCFQYPEYQLFEETVAKDIAFGPVNMGLGKEEIDRRVRQAISFVGLDSSYLDKSPFDLSGGEKRRVAIAGVMAMEPEILVLDEPCAGLDPKGRDTILELIKQYREKTGSTVIIISHSMEDVAKLATKVLVMNKGRVAAYGSVDEVYSRHTELVEMGLNIPQITSLFVRLKEKGYNVRTNIYSVEEGRKELLSILKGGREK
ncbi:MAG: energy-coupling factor transporter ATPase [Ruminococcaceae bacterium]|nr:energy-coupling factor transporter ATPase [Oscillospiraceae bacterium]